MDKYRLNTSKRILLTTISLSYTTYAMIAMALPRANVSYMGTRWSGASSINVALNLWLFL